MRPISQKALDKIVDRLKEAPNLPLDPDETAQIQEAQASPDEQLVATGVSRPARYLIGRDAADDVTDVWVVDVRPKELEDAEWLDSVKKNLLRGVKYCYFVQGRTDWHDLREAIELSMATT